MRYVDNHVNRLSLALGRQHLKSTLVMPRRFPLIFLIKYDHPVLYFRMNFFPHIKIVAPGSVKNDIRITVFCAAFNNGAFFIRGNDVSRFVRIVKHFKRLLVAIIYDSSGFIYNLQSDSMLRRFLRFC